MRYQSPISVLLLLLVSACGSDEESARSSESVAPAPEVDAIVDTADKAGFQGVVTLVRDDPYSSNGIVSLELSSGRMLALATGAEPSWSSDRLVYLQKCNGNTSASQVVVQDESGFATIMSDCSDYGYKKSYTQPSISPDGEIAAVFDYEIETGEKTSRFGGLVIRAGLRLFRGASKPSINIYDVSSPAFSSNGDLYALGFGDNPGLFRVDLQSSTAKRIDDGRLTGQSYSLALHPKGSHALFVNNGHIWEVELRTGEPKRLLVYSHEIAFVDYSPDGEEIAFVTRDPLREAIDLRGEKRINIFDREQVTAIPVSFVPSGPISWEE